MVLNTETGLTTPQFHIRFDERFETVKTNPKMKGLNKWQTVTCIRESPSRYKALNNASKRQKLISPPSKPPNTEKGTAQPAATTPETQMNLEQPKQNTTPKPQKETVPTQPQRELAPQLQRELASILPQNEAKGETPKQDSKSNQSDSTPKVTRTEVDRGMSECMRYTYTELR